MLGDHLLGLYEKALPPEMTWKERLSAVKELGYEFMEISIDEKDERLARLDWTDAEKKDLHDAMSETGIFIQSMCLSGHRRFPYGSADPKIRERAHDIMHKAILFAREFGIRVIQLAGYDVYYEPSTDASLALFLEGLKDACADAERYEVMLAMEIMDTELMSTITRYKKWKAQIPSPWFTVYPDVGNLSAWGNDTMAELELGKGEIVAVHLKDTIAVTPEHEGTFKGVTFGEGCVDFTACFKQLESQGFTGPFMMEMWYKEGEDWEKTIKDALAFINEKYDAAMN